DTLEVLRRLEGPYGASVGDPEPTHFGPIEKLLDNHPTAFCSMINSGLSIMGHDDALAGCQRIVLDDIGRPEFAECLIGLSARQAFSGTSSGHAGYSHHLLGERLAAF